MDNSIIVKRPVLIKTVVTAEFKTKAVGELEKELHLIESQIMQLEIQNKQIVNQITPDFMDNQIKSSIDDVSQKIDQMRDVKIDLQAQKESITRLVNENIIVTGSLDNYVKLSLGENLYTKFKDAEIIIENGIIKEINI